MGRIAVVFPGQGSQKVGMGRDFYESTDIGRELFDRADSLLGFSLTQLCFEGPEDLLTRTENAQPAIFTASLIAWELLRARGIAPAAVAGHSLGEYSALVAAGVMSFEDGLRTVRRRGELMAEIGDRVGGGMAAILNLDPAIVAEVCREASDSGCVEVANYNSAGQTIISGELAPLERAMALAKERGAKRAQKLSVAAPFHSSLMAPLVGEMEAVLAAVAMEPPTIPVVANVTADYVRTPEEVRAALSQQVAGSVRWTETIQRLAADGIEGTVEAGPGKVLTSLTPRIVPGLTAMDTAEALLVSW
ncbi:MAG: malonyl CoA-acyl carrier protein transacylase [Armatimonadetes bacterium]|jgi:[acyl-carrier-protein] S-malonyltransferase|nr:malonyl CoA-acyl carrier protein transacylase [Armatimonadota bacterium]